MCLYLVLVDVERVVAICSLSLLPSSIFDVAVVLSWFGFKLSLFCFAAELCPVLRVLMFVMIDCNDSLIRSYVLSPSFAGSALPSFRVECAVCSSLNVRCICTCYFRVN